MSAYKQAEKDIIALNTPELHHNKGIHLLDLKGKLKTKRYNSMVQSIDSKSLGPLAVVGRKDPLEEVTFSELKPGVNEGKVVLGKVICSVHSDDTVPFTFCLTDKSSKCVAVNLYNLAPGKGVIIGDSVAISEPNFSKIEVQVRDEEIAFDVIRVESPLVLVINGKKASNDFQAGIELSTFAKSD